MINEAAACFYAAAFCLPNIPKSRGGGICGCHYVWKPLEGDNGKNECGDPGSGGIV